MDVVDVVDEHSGSDADKVAIFIRNFSPSNGMSQVISQQISELASAGKDVSVFCFKNRFDSVEDSSVTSLYSPDNAIISGMYNIVSPFDPVSTSALLRSLREFDAAIVHQYPFDVVSHLCKKIYGTAYIRWYHHDLEARESGKGLVNKLYIRINSVLKTQAPSYLDPDVVCTVSKSSREEFERKTGKEAVVVQNKVNTERFSDPKTPDELEATYGFDPTRPTIVYVGRINTNKNIHDLVEAYNDVSETFGDVQLILVGEIQEEQYAKELTDMAREGVFFTGWVSDDTLAGIYSVADVYSSASVSEGFNLPIAEAQLFDCPIVVFDIPPHRENLSDYDRSYLVDQGDLSIFSDALARSLFEGQHDE